MAGPRSRWFLSLLIAALVACGVGTDAATRLASDIEAGARRLGPATGATHSIQHKTPSKSGDCAGPFTVQLDKVGALIIWCKGASGSTVASHSTSYHARFIDTPKTYIVEKAAGTTLTIDLERRDGRAVVIGVR